MTEMIYFKNFIFVSWLVEKSFGYTVYVCYGYMLLLGIANVMSFIVHTITAPLPTYVMGPISKDQVSFYGTSGYDGGELCDNITFLGEFLCVCVYVCVCVCLSVCLCVCVCVCIRVDLSCTNSQFGAQASQLVWVGMTV